jgi:ketosteroid isomerase-like protein
MSARFLRLLVSCVVVASPFAAADAQALDRAALESWLERYGAAWEARDAGAAGDIFAEDALYQETPFEEPHKGRAGIREYWSRVTADQRDIDFRFDVVPVTANTGVARWSAKFRLESTGDTLELDGVFVLEFAADGLCTSLREWWHIREL